MAEAQRENACLLNNHRLVMGGCKANSHPKLRIHSIAGVMEKYRMAMGFSSPGVV